MESEPYISPGKHCIAGPGEEVAAELVLRIMGKLALPACHEMSNTVEVVVMLKA